jgi:hypothetical protein
MSQLLCYYRVFQPTFLWFLVCLSCNTYTCATFATAPTCLQPSAYCCPREARGYLLVTSTDVVSLLRCELSFFLSFFLCFIKIHVFMVQKNPCVYQTYLINDEK